MSKSLVTKGVVRGRSVTLATKGVIAPWVVTGALVDFIQELYGQVVEIVGLFGELAAEAVTEGQSLDVVRKLWGRW